MITLNQYVTQEMAKIDADERFHYPPASIFSNAPLALIQTDLKTRYQMLKEIKEQFCKDEE